MSENIINLFHLNEKVINKRDEFEDLKQITCLNVHRKDKWNLQQVKTGNLVVNFTNILHAAFTLVDPESVKNTVKY